MFLSPQPDTDTDSRILPPDSQQPLMYPARSTLHVSTLLQLYPSRQSTCFLACLQINFFAILSSTGSSLINTTSELSAKLCGVYGPAKGCAYITDVQVLVTVRCVGSNLTGQCVVPLIRA